MFDFFSKVKEYFRQMAYASHNIGACLKGINLTLKNTNAQLTRLADMIETNQTREPEPFADAIEALDNYEDDPRPGIYVDFGSIDGKILGGPYRDKPEEVPGVKMAEEIDRPYEIKVDCVDFQTPDYFEMHSALIEAVMLMKHQPVIYAGCMGGVGRTGMFMALMKRLEIALNGGKDGDAITWVRGHYNHHAVETEPQMDFVNGFDIDRVARFVSQYVL